MLNPRLILFLFLVNSGFAQDFKESQSFKITATRSLLTEDLMSIPHEKRPLINCYVYDVAYPNQKLIEIKPDEYEVFDTVYVSELTNPGLKNISKVLRVEVSYSACCSWSTISFYLITKSGDFIQLPDLKQATCDWPAEINEYYFPVQRQNGQKHIEDVMLSINSEGEIDTIKTNHVLLWNGKKYSVPNE